MKNRVLLAAVTAVVVTVNPCMGEDGDRPSRTAPDGSQVIDYVAELESDVDSLKRQVIALENELSHKNDLLEQSAEGKRRPSSAVEDKSALIAKELSETQERLAGQSERLQAQSAQISEQGRKIAELTAVVESQKTFATRHESRDLDLTKQLEERVKAFQAQEAKLRHLETEKGGLAARLAEASARETDLRARVVQIEERAKASQSQETLLRKVEQEKEALASQLADSSARERELQTNLKLLEAAVLDGRKKGEQIAQVQENERKLMTAQANLNAEIESKKALLASRDSYTQELEERLKQQTAALEVQRAKLTQSESQKRELEVQLLRASARERELLGRVAESPMMVRQSEEPGEQNKEKLLAVTQELVKKPEKSEASSALQLPPEPKEQSRAGQQLASIAPSATQDVRLRTVVTSERAAQNSSNTILSAVRAEITAVRAQFSQRDKLFAEYASSKPALMVSPARAVSRTGETLSDLETALMKATNPREAARIKKSLEEIKRALDEDIKLIQRLNRK